MDPTHTFTPPVLTSTYLLRADLVSVLIFVFIRLKFSPPVTQFPIVENNFSLIKHGDKRTEINSDKQVKLILFSCTFSPSFSYPLFPSPSFSYFLYLLILLYPPLLPLSLTLFAHSNVFSLSLSLSHTFFLFPLSLTLFLNHSFSYSFSHSLTLPPLFLSTRLNLHTLSYFLCTLFPPPSHTFFAAFSSLFFSFSFYQCCRGNII